MTMTNYIVASITAVKSFIVQALPWIFCSC